MPTSRRREDPDYGFPPARGGRGAPSMFPRKLFQILCETDQAVVGWDIDGKSFFIANLQEFVEGVMPMYYRHNKLTSFQRQLNLYGESDLLDGTCCFLGAFACCTSRFYSFVCY